MRVDKASVIAVISRMVYFKGYLTFSSEDAALNRELYLGVKQVLEVLGGKYATKIQAFKFKYNPTEVIQSIVSSGVLPNRKTFEFFPTPEAIVNKMIKLGFDGRNLENLKFLEPSAGNGAIVKALRSQGVKHIECVEIDPIHCETLKRDGIDVFCGNIADYQPTTYFDGIIMNPPFKHYIEHLFLAWQYLNLEGVLVAIVPASFKNSTVKEVVNFRELLYEYDGTIIDLPKGSFNESGTNVNTCMITMQKIDREYKYKPFEGFKHYISYHIVNFIDNHYSLYLQYKRMMKNGITVTQVEALIKEACKILLEEYETPYAFTQEQITVSVISDVYEHYTALDLQYVD